MSDHDEPWEPASDAIPPKDTRFRRGVSGNPKGRPRKAVRAYTPRQLRRDIILQMEKEMTVQANGQRVKIVTYLALLKKLVAMGMSGHGPSCAFWSRNITRRSKRMLNTTSTSSDLLNW